MVGPEQIYKQWIAKALICECFYLKVSVSLVKIMCMISQDTIKQDVSGHVSHLLPLSETVGLAKEAPPRCQGRLPGLASTSTLMM